MAASDLVPLARYELGGGWRGMPLHLRVTAAAYRARLAIAPKQRVAIAALGWLATFRSTGHQFVDGNELDRREIADRIEMLQRLGASAPRVWRRSLRRAERQWVLHGRTVPPRSLTVDDQLTSLETALGLRTIEHC